MSGGLGNGDDAANGANGARVVRAARALGATGLDRVVADGARNVVVRSETVEALARAEALLDGARREAAAIREAARQEGWAEGLRAAEVAAARGDAGDEAPATVAAGAALIGRILDCDGRPIDAGPPLPADELVSCALERLPPPPLAREPIALALPTGVRAIDALCTLGIGQRLALSAGPGLGKSTLLGQLARQTDASANVIALVGERGREVRSFVEGALGAEGLARSVVVVSTADEPAERRIRAVLTATAIAEHLRDAVFAQDGGHVLLLVDSLTRVARALRDRALREGEAPALGGYPASVLSALPRLLERAGNSAIGRMTAVFTVLESEGDPISAEIRSLLDGQLSLSAAVAESGRWPAVDVAASVSRAMSEVASTEHREHARRLRSMLALLAERGDLVALGAYRRGTDPELDAALLARSDIDALLSQAPDERAPFAATLARLARIVA